MMRNRFLFASLSLLFLIGAATGFDGGSAATNPLKLTLPPVWYAVPGVEMSLYFDNAVLTERPEDYRFEVDCDLGASDGRRWAVMPGEGDAGDHALRLIVRWEGRVLGEAATTLRIAPASAGAGRNVTLLIVGDSLTHATSYPNEIARLLSAPGNPEWRMLGTHRPPSAAPGVAHEGYGGWTWERFVTRYEPQADQGSSARSSPFVDLTDGRPRLDVVRYLREHGGGSAPSVIVFLLGINDCFNANPEDPAAIDAAIDAMFRHADTLLAAFRQAAPGADLGLCLTPPPNARESGFEADYQGRTHRWGWKRIQHRLVQRQIEKFGGREGERIHLVPVELNVDPVEGYPEDNGVHPNDRGYRQIAASIYAWLKWRLSISR
jgi:lysophospholipase L1-like esterase